MEIKKWWKVRKYKYWKKKILIQRPFEFSLLWVYYYYWSHSNVDVRPCQVVSVLMKLFTVIAHWFRHGCQMPQNQTQMLSKPKLSKVVRIPKVVKRCKQCCTCVNWVSGCSWVVLSCWHLSDTFFSSDSFQECEKFFISKNLSKDNKPINNCYQKVNCCQNSYQNSYQNSWQRELLRAVTVVWYKLVGNRSQKTNTQL